MKPVNRVLKTRLQHIQGNVSFDEGCFLHEVSSMVIVLLSATTSTHPPRMVSLTVLYSRQEVQAAENQCKILLNSVSCDIFFLRILSKYTWVFN